MSSIAIIGAGNVGRALAGSITAAGHDVVIAATRADRAEDAAAWSGARSAATPTEAVRGAEIVILAVRATALASVAEELRADLAGTIVVDVTNTPTPDLSDLAAPATSSAERLAELLPESRVVKAFNTAFAARMANPVVDGMPVDGFVAADDADAKAAILDLVGELGFRPVDAGPLPMARALEAVAWLNIYLNLSHGWSWQAGWKLIEPTRVLA